jgi:hypothetical protein
MLIGYICGTTVLRSKNAAPNEYGHLWEEIEQNRPSTVKEKLHTVSLALYYQVYVPPWNPIFINITFLCFRP